jgi:cell division FtsZ-interacting protein ZapD
MKYKASILNLLEDLGAKVSVYSVYTEEAAFDQPRFQNALATVYMDIISILVKAGQKLKKNRMLSPCRRGILCEAKT